MHTSGRLIPFVVLVGLGLTTGCEQPSPTESSAPAPAPAIAPRTSVRGGIEFIEGYDNGYQRAQQEGKPMLVFFTAQWCTFCRQMEAETLADSQVVRLAQQFVCVLVDADQEPGVCQEFRVSGYPTIQFLSARGVPLNRLTGKRPPQQLIAQMQAALQATAARDSQTTLR